MFDPKSAILIEGSDAILGLNVLGARLIRHFPDERNDCSLRRAIVPGWKGRSLSICANGAKHYGS
jgi:hypothetical protein